jgi:hypothetical protein
VTLRVNGCFTGQTGRLGGSGSLINTNRAFVFTPSFPLQFGTEYEVEVGTSLTDRQGNALQAQDKHAEALNIEWRGNAVVIVSFRRGQWENELLAMGRAIPGH